MMDIQLKGYEVTWNDDNVYFEHDEYGEDAGINYEGQSDIPKKVLAFMELLGYRSV